MARKKTQKLEGKTSKSLRIEWWYPEGQTGLSANQMLVQFDGFDFHMSFFDTQPPVIAGSDEEKKAAIEALESLRAKCVARIVVNKERMAEFIRALTDQWARIQAASEDTDDGDDSK